MSGFHFGLSLLLSVVYAPLVFGATVEPLIQIGEPAEAAEPDRDVTVALSLKTDASPAYLTFHAPRGAESAGEGRIVWNPEWPKFSAVEGGITAGLYAGTLAASLLWEAPDARWTSTNPFDDAVRGALRADSRSGLDTAATISDVLLYSMVALPFVLDAGALTWLGDGNGEVAWQIVTISAESFAVSYALNFMTKQLAGRERPYARGCGAGAPEPESECGHEDANRSFFSGHATSAFTGAGLVCTHHLNLKLFGNRAADTSACVAAMALATTTGVMRIVADKHYASDVLLGAGVGLFSGWLLPELLHYRGEADSRDGRTWMISPNFGPDFAGAGVSGTF